MFGIGPPEILIILIIITILSYLFSLQKLLLRCSNEKRSMHPFLVWLLLIPGFNFFWHFYVVIQIAKSIKNEFESNGEEMHSKFGLKVGIALSISPILFFISFLIGFFTSLILLIIYWTNIASYSSRLVKKTTKNNKPKTTQPSSSLSAEEKFSQIIVGMDKQKVISLVGKCKNITTMGGALNQLGGFVASKNELSKMSQTELWVYETNNKKYKFFLTNGVVDEVKSESK